MRKIKITNINNRIKALIAAGIILTGVGIGIHSFKKTSSNEPIETCDTSQYPSDESKIIIPDSSNEEHDEQIENLNPDGKEAIISDDSDEEVIAPIEQSKENNTPRVVEEPTKNNKQLINKAQELIENSNKDIAIINLKKADILNNIQLLRNNYDSLKNDYDKINTMLSTANDLVSKSDSKIKSSLIEYRDDLKEQLNILETNLKGLLSKTDNILSKYDTLDTISYSKKIQLLETNISTINSDNDLKEYQSIYDLVEKLLVDTNDLEKKVNSTIEYSNNIDENQIVTISSNIINKMYELINNFKNQKSNNDSNSGSNSGSEPNLEPSTSTTETHDDKGQTDESYDTSNDDPMPEASDDEPSLSI